MVEILEIENPNDRVWSEKNSTVISSFDAKNLFFWSGFECYRP